MFSRRSFCIAGTAAFGAAVLPREGVAGSPQGSGVRVTPNEPQRRVDITIDGAPFTSYIWPTTLKKPVLYPLRAADGTLVSRGYPLEPRQGERVDHPHHAGMWFNYGNVNGYDFWNNSDAIKPEDRVKMGTIRQDRIISTRSGEKSGVLEVATVWISGKGQDLLEETTRFVFSRHGSTNVIDRVTTLKALDQVVFHDDKEGLLGLRVAHFLESAHEKSGTFTDASGRVTKVEGADTTGATGVYTTSAGKQGEAAWGTRGRWCMLAGNNGQKSYTIAVFDHPRNPGYPTYWHARGYGLFAANPLGDSIFDPKAPPHNLTLEKGQSTTFRYRTAFYQGENLTPAEANQEANDFAGMYT